MRIPPTHVASIVKLDKMECYEAAKRDSAAERQKERIGNSYAKVLGLPDSSFELVHAV